MYGGKLLCKCKIINKESGEESKEACECEIYDDKKLPSKKKKKINPDKYEKIKETIQKLEKQLEMHKKDLKKLADSV